jgi:hypothetical protein
MNPNEADTDVKRVQDAIDTLGEWFDTVQIHVTRNTGEKDGNTLSISRGTGNWFARYGQIHDWLIRQDAITADNAVEENREGREEE